MLGHQNAQRIESKAKHLIRSDINLQNVVDQIIEEGRVPTL